MESHLTIKRLLSFNPCFSGSGVLSCFCSPIYIRNWCGFNPCFSGSGVLRIVDVVVNTPNMAFQSLFFWKWGFKYASCHTRRQCEGVSILVFLEVGF